MNQTLETKKRLNIAKKINTSLEGIVRGVYLGGSMGFGQNYSISKKSDIDLVVILDHSKLDVLESTWFFKGKVPVSVLKLFKKEKINLFWIIEKIRGIEINAFVYETKGYVDFCLLRDSLKGFIPFRPSETQEAYGFDGRRIIFHRKVVSHNAGFIYEKPPLVKGRYWGGVPRQDFLYSIQILYQEGEFLSNLEKRVWKTTIKQFIKEYGKHPDLDKINILNTHYAYQTARHKLPARIIKQIQSRTKRELKKYTSV